MVEYVIIAAIAAIGAIVTVNLFALLVLGLFNRLAAAVKNETPPATQSARFMNELRADTAIARDMANFDGLGPATPGGLFPGTPGGSRAGNRAPGIPAPPSPSDPLAYAARHHIGDSRAAGTSNDGIVVNEGATYSFDFFLTQEMIDYANYAHNGDIFITFDAGNRQFDYNNFIDNESANHVLLDGRSIGTIRNGRNSLRFNASGLNPGPCRISFTSGMLHTERDDYDFWNLMISSELD